MIRLDPCKRIILFFASIINVALVAVIFGYSWYEYYAGTMFITTFYRKGNYLVIGLYAMLVFFFASMYGSMKIGQLRRIEVLLSQYLSLLLANVVYYFVICLLAFRFVDIKYLLLVYLVQMIISTMWYVVVIKCYNRLFQPWKILLIYGDRPVVDLVYKIGTRPDKYGIYDAINIKEGLEAIDERMKDFQAVIIGDISAVERNDVLKFCYAKKIRAYVIPKISDVILMGTDKIHIFDTPFLLARGYTLSVDQRIMKRMMDIILSIIFLILTLPISIIVMIAIKINDGGDVFYKQERVTRNGKKFTMYKFRSMVMNAEGDGKARLAREDDKRVTKIGKIIRSTRIDELPQLINILRGDMSFVGPRPERPEIMDEYMKKMPEFSFRTRVKAGLTGYAQIYGKYNTIPYDKLKLDLFYIANYSMWTDIKLILMTIKTVFKRESTEGVSDNQDTAQRQSAATAEEEFLEQIRNLHKK